MTSTIKGLSVSFCLHGMAIFAVFCFPPASLHEEKLQLVMDFTPLALGEVREGGTLPGQDAALSGTGASTPETPLPPDNDKPSKQQQASPKAIQPPQSSAPIPKASPPQRAVHKKTREQKQAEKSRTAESPTSTQPDIKTDAKMGEKAGAQADAKPGVEPGAGPGAGKATNKISGNGQAGGRGSDAGSGSGREEGLAQGYVKTNFNYILVSIKRSLEYPSYAKRKRLSGVSQFSFVIKMDGTIEHLHLERSSGHKILDEAAEAAIRKASPFPKPPIPALLVVPIEYRLS